MYFWDIKGLKLQLTTSGLPQADSLKYFLLLAMIGMIPIPKPPYLSSGTALLSFGNFIHYLIGTVIFLCGSIYCYRKNHGSIGKEFLSRYISISWVVSVRLVPILILFGSIISTGILLNLNAGYEKAIIYSFIYAFSIFYYWRVGHHISGVSLKEIAKVEIVDDHPESEFVICMNCHKTYFRMDYPGETCPDCGTPLIGKT
jgi:hypothetical protein